MGNYLSREQILDSGVQTQDVDAFGGTVCVRELDALTMQKLIKAGALDVESGALDFSKVDLVEVAQRHVVDPETLEPILKKGDVQKLVQKGWASIMTIVSATMETSGLEVELEDGEELGPDSKNE